MANLGSEICSFAAFKVRNGEKIEIKSLSPRTGSSSILLSDTKINYNFFSAVLDGSLLITLRAKTEIEGE